jgi:hypothetical protein
LLKNNQKVLDNSIQIHYNPSILIRKVIKMLIDTIQSLPISEKRALVKTLKEIIRQEAATNRTLRVEAKAAKREASAAKKATRIAKLQAKLEALKNPVGSKATKANKRPSKAVVTKGVAA